MVEEKLNTEYLIDWLGIDPSNNYSLLTKFDYFNELKSNQFIISIFDFLIFDLK